MGNRGAGEARARSRTFWTKYRSRPIFIGKPVDRVGASTLILNRNLFHVISNDNVAENSP